MRAGGILCRRRIFITTCLALCCVITGTQHISYCTSAWETLFPDSAGTRSVWGLRYLPKPIHPANIDLWNVAGSRGAGGLPRRSAALLQFLSPYVWLNKSSVLSLHTSCSQVDADKQGWSCCLQTRSYIIYSFKLSQPRWSAVPGHRVSSTPGSQGRVLSHWPSAERLMCCGGKRPGLRRPACVCVLISQPKKEAIFPSILHWRSPEGASAEVGLTTPGCQTQRHRGYVQPGD